MLLTAPWGFAQTAKSPHIGYVYPAGGRQGKTFRTVVGGQYLTGVSGVDISGGGIRAVVVEYNKPLTQKQLNELRQQVRELQARKTAAMKGGSPAGKGESQPSAKPAQWTPEDERALTDLRKKIFDNAPNRQASPVIAETVTLDVTTAPDASPGRRELRLITPIGLSNPLVFCVDHLPEFMETESTAKSATGNFRTGQAGRRTKTTKKETTLTLPVVLNGQIMPGDVDRFRFEARKGQHLVAAVKARELVPYLADAVPGWFQAVLVLYDAEGNELAYVDDHYFHPDPVLYCEIPADGEYEIEIRDSIYRGREDFVYRIAIGELPFVTSIFPLGSRAGRWARVELAGWNLPVTRIRPDARNLPPGAHPISVGKGQRLSNYVPFAVDTLPERPEREANDSLGAAERVTPPVIVNGRIDQPGDCDVFCFERPAGAEVVVEVRARRLGSPLDSVLRLMDAAGRQLAFSDDQEDKAEGLITHHADSRLRATLSAAGTYYVHVADAQGKGGADYGYRLRISPPQPDFALRIVPSSINIRGGATIPLSVYALRRDGFDADIMLSLKDAPAGFVLSGAWVPAGKDQVQVTLTAPRTPTVEPLSLSVEGRAKVAGRAIVRPVVPADDMMQAFFYRHLVPAQELKVAVSGQRMFRNTVPVLSKGPVRIPAGGTASVLLGASARAYASGTMELEVTDPPEGIVVEKITPSRNRAQIVLRSDAEKVRPGLKGNLIVTAFRSRPPTANQKTPANKRRTPVGILPAIPFEVTQP